MTTVSEGMDVAHVRQIAQSMLGLSSQLGSVKSRGDAQVSTLEHVWSGDDLDAFTGSWHETSPGISHTADALRQMGRQLQDEAQEQEVASGGSGGSRFPAWPNWPNLPDLPDLKPPQLPGQGALDRLLDLVGDAWEGFVTVVQKGLDILTSLPVTIAQLVDDVRSLIMEYSAKASQWVDDVARGLRDAVAKWGPRIAALGEKWLPKIASWGSKLTKWLPVLGVVGAIYDSWDIIKDIWNGEMSPRDVYDLLVTGGAAVAAFFPPIGTAISVVLTLESLRVDALDWLREEHPDALWSQVAQGALIGGGWVLLGPLSLFGSFLPTENQDLPGPPPKEVWADAWEIMKDDDLRAELWPPKPFAHPVVP